MSTRPSLVGPLFPDAEDHSSSSASSSSDDENSSLSDFGSDIPMIGDSDSSDAEDAIVEGMQQVPSGNDPEETPSPDEASASVTDAVPVAALVAALQSKLRRNTRDYQSYVQLVEVLETSAQLSHRELLTHTRDKFYQHFPLPARVWRSHLHALAAELPSQFDPDCAPEPEKNIIRTFEKALLDCPTVDIWMDYIRFLNRRFACRLMVCLDEGTDPSVYSISDLQLDAHFSPESIRRVLARAVQVCGWSYSQAPDLWLLYFQTELAFDDEVFPPTMARDSTFGIVELSEILDLPEGAFWPTFSPECIDEETASSSRGSASLSKSRAQESKTDRLRRIISRALRAPVENPEPVMAALEAWLADLSEDELPSGQRGKLRALSADARREATELAPLEAGAFGPTASIEGALAYVDAVEAKRAKSNPFRAQVVYEQAIAAFPFSQELWSRYCRFADRYVTDPVAALNVHHRAVRFCGWSGAFWAGYLAGLERFGSCTSAATALVQQAMSSGLLNSVDEVVPVYLALGALLLRSARAVLTGDSAASLDVVPEVAALRDALRAGIARAQSLNPPAGDLYFRLERFWARAEYEVLGDPAAGQTVYESIIKLQGRSAELWIEYAKLELAYNRAQPQWRTVFRRAAGANIADNPAALFAEWLTCEGLHGGPADHADALRRVEVQQKILADRYAQALSAQAAAATAANEAPAEPRRRAAAARRTAESVESLPKADGPASKGEKVVSKVAEPVPKVDKPPPAEGATEGTNLSEPKKRTRAEDTSSSVFLSNLSFKATEEDIRAFFETFATVTSVRIVKNPRGISKGFAYVDLGDEMDVSRALARDRSTLIDRPLFISPVKPKEASAKQARPSPPPTAVVATNILKPRSVMAPLRPAHLAASRPRPRMATPNIGKTTSSLFASKSSMPMAPTAPSPASNSKTDGPTG
ncbi:hypothetical protein H696_03203 [Fonticula alba]|uniref:RRM domain-containing protein n=1 Tax=Fonticula alba TaxID=691883 RepID=A0A058Z9Q2_FONAL|nr:hypothetical protein H696_03203 [Fonticula alba]KCV70846.1 hypothetical protein H696_03203 [Fonticula alba]|eukprot:XP_009495362.1 hypothetical protein H696_03203 [Fonticula alba]